MSDEAVELRVWIDQLPAQSFFFTDEIPGWSPSLRFTLARIATDPAHPLVRVSRGFFCKCWHQDSSPQDQARTVNVRLASLYLAGEGGGAASWNALNLVGWTAQHPRRKDVGCVGRPPRSPWEHTRFVQRNNERRRELSWAEVTLLEAVRMFESGDLDWDEAVEVITSGDYLGRLRYGAEVDTERFRWGAEGEIRQPNAFHSRVEDLSASMPDHDSFVDWRARAVLAKPLSA